MHKINEYSKDVVFQEKITENKVSNFLSGFVLSCKRTKGKQPSRQFALTTKFKVKGNTKRQQYLSVLYLKICERMYLTATLACVREKIQPSCFVFKHRAQCQRAALH